MAAEYWVMRVVVDRAAMPLVLPAQVARDVASGALVMVGGSLMAPVRDHTDHERAIADAQREHAATGCEHAVVLSADVADLAR